MKKFIFYGLIIMLLIPSFAFSQAVQRYLFPLRVAISNENIENSRTWANLDSAVILFDLSSDNWKMTIYDKTGAKQFEIEGDGDLFISGDGTFSDATPVLQFKDVSATAGDVNASIQADATDTGDGSEDIDITMKQQIAGAITAFLTADADGVVTIGSATQNVTVAGDLTVSGDGIFLTTNTDGYMLIADGTNFNPVAISGNISITNAGVVSVTAIQSGANPTTSVAGDVAIDTDDYAIEVYDDALSVSVLNSNVYDLDGLIFAPDGINDEIPIFHVDAAKYPHGIKLLNVQITIPSDAEYSMVFEEWSGDPPAAQNDIETVTTGAGDSYMEVTGVDIDDSDIDADDYIFLDIPATDVDWIHVKVIFYIVSGD